MSLKKVSWVFSMLLAVSLEPNLYAVQNCCEYTGAWQGIYGWGSSRRLTRRNCEKRGGIFYPNHKLMLGIGCVPKDDDDGRGSSEAGCSPEVPFDDCCALTGYEPDACHNCGDGLCATGEGSCNCPLDCPGPCAVCGDGICEYPDNSDNCPTDCPVAKFYFEALPEPPAATASEASGVSFLQLPSITDACYSLSVGRATTPVGTRAIAWERDCSNGGPWQTTELPLPSGANPNATTAGFSVACDGSSQVCVAYGIWQNPASPWNALVWVKPAPGDPWAPETLPLPPGHVAFSGKNGATNVFDHFDCPDCLTVAGSTVDPNGRPKATVWKRPLADQGAWVMTLLPDGGPGTTSLAADAIMNNDARLIIAGSAEDVSGELNACIWHEMMDGIFALTLLQRLPGPTCGPPAAGASLISRTTGDDLAVAGFSHILDCSRHAALWRKQNGVWEAPIDLGTLPGYSDSEIYDPDGNGMDDTIDLYIVGHSNNGPGTERATVWEVKADGSVYMRDADSLTANLPPGVNLAFPAGDSASEDAASFSIVGSYTTGGPDRHAYALTSIPKPEFHFQALPEPPGAIMSSAKLDCLGMFDPGPEPVTFVGGCTPTADETPAVVWEVHDGVAGDPVMLPDPYCDGVLCDRNADTQVYFCESQVNPVCRFGGFATDVAGYRQPVLWTRDPATATYSAEVLPLPPDAVRTESGMVGLTVDFADVFCSVGTAVTKKGQSQATAWTRQAGDDFWQVETLPGTGLGSTSQATTVTTFAGFFIVGGEVQILDVISSTPCVWEASKGGGWTLVELPIPPGMTMGPVTSLTSGTQSVDALGYSVTPVVIPFRWERNVKGFWDPPTALSALPGYPQAIPSQAATICGDCVNVVGTSYNVYPFGGAIPQPRATFWNVPQDFPMTAYDLNQATVDLPGGVALSGAVGLPTVDDLQVRGGPGCDPFPGWPPMIVGTYHNAPGGLRGQGLPHAYLLTPAPPSCGICQLYGDVVSEHCLVDVDDLLCVLDDFADPLLCAGDGDIFPCGGGDNIYDVDDILAVLAAFTGFGFCPHPCPP